MSYLAKIANLSTYKTRQIARPYRVGCLFVYVRVFGDTLQDMNGNPLLFYKLKSPCLVARGSENKMKKLLVSLFFIALIILLVLTSPPKKVHSESITNAFNDAIRNKSDNSDMLGMLMDGATSYFLSIIVDKNLIVDNYLIFSLGKFETQEESKVVSVGILNHVFTLGAKEMLEPLESSSTNKKNGNASVPTPDFLLPKTQSKQNGFSSGIEKNANRNKYPHKK